MQRVTTWVGVVAACTVVTALVATAPPASADLCDVDATGICLDGLEPGTPAPGDSGSSSPAPSTDGGGCEDQSGAVLPCADGYGGSWSGAPHWCYQYQLDPQPPAGSPLWNGQDPAAGSVWSCDYSLAVPGNTWFVPNGAAVVDAGSVAQDLLSRANFAYADASTAPGGGDPTYVGYSTWLWIPESQWQPVSASLTVSGATVTIQGTPTEVDWSVGQYDLGCAGPGRAWSPDLGEQASTTCSIKIEQLDDPEGDRLPVSARIEYAVTWTCSGRCSTTTGDLGTVSALPGATAELFVRQRQTVVAG